MSVYSSDLFTLRGEVKSVKPSASKETVDSAINKRIRRLFDRHSWSDSLRIGVINLGNSYTTGTISYTPNSNIVTGTGAAWPVNDWINTTISGVNNVSGAGVVDYGVSNIIPGAMTNIAPGQWLVVDTGGNQEVVQVLNVSTIGFSQQFSAFFKKPHANGVALQASSLAGQQFKANFPIYTVQAVFSATSLQIDNPWQGQPQTQNNLPYNIYNGYVSVTPNTRRIMFAWDPIQGQPIDIWHNQQDLAVEDPQRTNVDSPLWLAQTPPSPVGIAQWEVWPAQFTSYQFSVVTCEQWPKLVHDNDMAPGFINPDGIVAGARADVLRIPVIPREGRTDPYHNPQLAQVYEAEWESIYEEARQADEGRASTLLSSYMRSLADGVTYNFLRNHPAATADGSIFSW